MIPHLLVTDDDSAFRGVLSEALERCGFEVVQASDGDQALEILANRSIHFALVDVHMPRVTGLDVLRGLLDFPKRPPCALMSADLDEEIVIEAERMHAYRVLPKPLRIQEVREVVRGAMTDIYGWKRV